jgi:putative addiction module killer protein
MRIVEIRHYLTSAGRDPYQTWLDRLKDLRARVAIQRRIDRIAAGHFSDHKPCRDGD